MGSTEDRIGDPGFEGFRALLLGTVDPLIKDEVLSDP